MSGKYKGPPLPSPKTITRKVVFTRHHSPWPGKGGPTSRLETIGNNRKMHLDFIRLGSFVIGSHDNGEDTVLLEAPSGEMMQLSSEDIKALDRHLQAFWAGRF